MKFVTIALLALLALATQSATAFTRFTQYGSVPPPQTFEGVLKSLDTPAQWYDNYVDHFNPQDTRKFKQRFFENTEFADNSNPNAPIFVYIGSEGQLSANWVNSGLMYNNAKAHGASLVALEHRYYGESQPMPNHSFENLRYLTSEQALEDLATFIRWYANNKVTWSRARPIIVFGGSYGATLAAHMRARHPHIVRGAIASSAPFEPEVNFPEYYDVATDALTFFGGDECRTRFGLAATVIKSKLSTPEGRAEVGAKLNVCTPLTPGNMDNINTQAFWTSITDTWAGLVQYNKENTPGRMSIGSFCKTLSDPSTNFWDAYFDGFHQLRTPDTCFKWTYNDMLADLADTTIVPKNNMRQWIYQTCTEWGFYQTLESPKQVYGPKDAVKLELFVKLCQDGYSPKLNKAYILDAADRTRDAYGGWYFQATNVALANGNIDPWHSISIFEKCGKRHPSITIHNAEGTSHCAILYPEQSYDPATLVESRKEIADVITTYVNSKF